MRRAYFEFADMIRMNDDGYFPYTPPTQLFHGMKASIARLEADGLENVFARQAGRGRGACAPGG